MAISKDKKQALVSELTELFDTAKMTVAPTTKARVLQTCSNCAVQHAKQA